MSEWAQETLQSMWILNSYRMRGLVLLLGLLLLGKAVAGSIDGEEGEPIPQPEVIESPLSLQCCHLSQNPQMLQTCVADTSYTNNFLRKAATKKSMVSMYTYVSKNIIKYSAYSTMVNMVYAEHNQYDFHIMGTNKSNDPYAESTDHRWNKVHILWEALMKEPEPLNPRPKSQGMLDFRLDDPIPVPPSPEDDNAAAGRAVAESAEEEEPYYDDRYIVWVDADLIITDLGMRIEEIAADYPDADLIMSRDVAKAEFVSNSGFIIVRKSAWSMDFFEKWWTAYDRTRCCDQNAFTWLYDKFDQANLTHVKLLRPDAINTNFPAFKNQKDDNQVLHLAGASDLYRRPVFTHAMQDICRAGYDQNMPLTWWSWGVRKVYYYHALFTLGSEVVDSLFKQRKSLSTQLGLSTTVLMTYLVRLSHDRVELLTKLTGQIKVTPCLREGIWEAAAMTTDDDVAETDMAWVEDYFTRVSVDRASGKVLDEDEEADPDIEEENTLLPPYYFPDDDEDGLEVVLKKVETVNLLVATLDDAMKEDHEDTAAFELDFRGKMGDGDPSLTEKSLSSNLRRWIFCERINIAISLAYLYEISNRRLLRLRIMKSTGIHTQLTTEDEDWQKRPKPGKRKEDRPFYKLLRIYGLTNIANKHAEADEGMTKIRLMVLEALKEAISAGFESVIALDTLPGDGSEDQRGLLLEVDKVLFDLFSGLAPEYLAPKLLYYRFKHYQLLSGTWSNALAPILKSPMGIRAEDSGVVGQAVGSMHSAVEYWKEMATYNYFGSEYVMADPYKEGAELMNKLGAMQCVTRAYEKGLATLQDSYELLDTTLDNYRALRIASRKTILEGQIALAETLLNYGVCAIERQESLVFPMLSVTQDDDDEDDIDEPIDLIEMKLRSLYEKSPDGVRNLRSTSGNKNESTLFDDIVRATVGLTRARTIFKKVGEAHGLEEYVHAAEVASEFVDKAKKHYVALRSKVAQHYLNKKRGKGKRSKEATQKEKEKQEDEEEALHEWTLRAQGETTAYDEYRDMDQPMLSEMLNSAPYMGYFGNYPLDPEVMAAESAYQEELEKELSGNGDELSKNLCIKGSCGKIDKVTRSGQDSGKVNPNSLVPPGGGLELGKRYTVDVNGIRELLPNELPLSSPIFFMDPSNPGKLVQEKTSVMDISHGGKKQISDKDIKSIASIIKKTRGSRGSSKARSAKASSRNGVKDEGGEDAAKVQYRRKSRKRKSSSN